MSVRPRAHRDERGVVMLEFLLAFLPLFVLFLGLLQLALLEVGDLVVRHAAVDAARSASVVLYDDPQYYDGTATGDARDSSPRMTVIRGAAHARLAAISPAWPVLARAIDPALRASAADAIGVADLSRYALALLLYLPVTTAIGFPREPGSVELLDDLAQADQLTLRITQLVPCAVPVAGALLCRTLEWKDDQLRAKGADARTQRALDELKLAPRAPLQRLLAESGLSFMVLQAEASLPAQRANYAYKSEREKEQAR